MSKNFWDQKSLIINLDDYFIIIIFLIIVNENIEIINKVKKILKCTTWRNHIVSYIKNIYIYISHICTKEIHNKVVFFSQKSLRMNLQEMDVKIFSKIDYIQLPFFSSDYYIYSVFK